MLSFNVHFMVISLSLMIKRTSLCMKVLLWARIMFTNLEEPKNVLNYKSYRA